MSDITASEHTIDEIYDEVSGLRDLFARRLMDDKIKNAAIDKLSVSNASLVKALEDNQTTSIARELILICDRIYSQPVTDEFAYSVLDEILEVLSRRGINQIQQLDTFDPKLHNCVSTIPSSDEAQPNTISSIVRHGYMTNQKIIRPADVIVVSEK